MRWWIMFFSFFQIMPAFAGRLIECNADNNVVATNIFGLWEYDSNLSEVVGDTENELARIRFTDDPSALEHFVPTERWLAEDTCVYAIGFMDLYSTKAEDGLLARPFVLTALNGAPLLFWLESYGEDYDGEAFQVALAPGSSSDRDRLILGNDLNLEGVPVKFLKRVLE